MDHLDKQVVPKLKYILAQAIDTQRPSLVLRAILLIAILVKGIHPLPSDLEPFLADRLKRLGRSMASEDYTHMSGYSQLVDTVRSISIPVSDNVLWRELSRLQARLTTN
ncbi:hypothetical protein PSACC_00846 [Paramicrosporidium saccamoebae]|uniref:Uncharacterized protein n=1 Tax=Paramicrosporidium saccamoebae TaxID=1246581 RepID=A0A2H9TNN7_9FUNG|nr:hypothetical protein PSACC_00846 [Paramicrosporidium saccamoebae]